MTQLTNEMIIKNFNISTQIFKTGFKFFVVISLIIGIIYFIKFKKEKTTSGKKGIIAAITIAFLLICILQFKDFLKYNAISYSLENNSWYVEIDTVARTKLHTDGDGNTSYYVYLTEHGKVSISQKTYSGLSKGSSVYVVIAKGRFGGTYATSQIYSTNRYIYQN